MPDLDLAHPLAKGYRAWKKWEEILFSGRTQANRHAGEDGSPIATGHAAQDLPEPASLAELQFWGEMKQAYQARFEDDLRMHLAANPETTREAVERELESLMNPAPNGSRQDSTAKKST